MSIEETDGVVELVEPMLVLKETLCSISIY